MDKYEKSLQRIDKASTMLEAEINKLRNMLKDEAYLKRYHDEHSKVISMEMWIEKAKKRISYNYKFIHSQREKWQELCETKYKDVDGLYGKVYLGILEEQRIHLEQLEQALRGR